MQGTTPSLFLPGNVKRLPLWSGSLFNVIADLLSDSFPNSVLFILVIAAGPRYERGRSITKKKYLITNKMFEYQL